MTIQKLSPCRAVWTDPHGLFAGMQARARPVNHQHLDIGSFVLDCEGERWAVDLGADNYNLPGYFGGNRYEYYRLRAEGHNTLVIKPGVGPDQNPSARCKIERFVSQPDHAFAVADLSDAYDGVADCVERGLALLGRRHVLVQDEISNPRGDVWWFMHTQAKVKLDDDHRMAKLEQNGRKLTARLLSPKDGQLQVMDPTPFPSSPHPVKQGENTGVQRRFLPPAVEVVVLAGNCPADEQPTHMESKDKPLKDW